MEIKKKQIVEYVISGKYTPDPSRRIARVGDLVVIEDVRSFYIYLVARVGQQKVQLVGLKSGNVWSDPVTYDPNGIPLSDLVGREENVYYYVLKKIDE